MQSVDNPSHKPEFQYGTRRLFLAASLSALGCAGYRAADERSRYRQARSSWDELIKSVDAGHAVEFRVTDFENTLRASGYRRDDVVTESDYLKTFKKIATRSLQRIAKATSGREDLYLQARFGCADRDEFADFGIVKMIAYQVESLNKLESKLGQHRESLYERKDLIRAVRVHTDPTLRTILTTNWGESSQDCWMNGAANGQCFRPEFDLNALTLRELCIRMTEFSKASGLTPAELGLEDSKLRRVFAPVIEQLHQSSKDNPEHTAQFSRAIGEIHQVTGPDKSLSDSSH